MAHKTLFDRTVIIQKAVGMLAHVRHGLHERLNLLDFRKLYLQLVSDLLTRPVVIQAIQQQVERL